MSHWENLNPVLLPKYQAVVFLETRHEDRHYRAALPHSLMHACEMSVIAMSYACGYAATIRAIRRPGPASLAWNYAEYTLSSQYAPPDVEIKKARCALAPYQWR
jgi:hypothetical protein